MAKNLLALADDLEEKARALRYAHQVLTGERVTAAKRGLPRKLAAASRQLRTRRSDGDGDHGGRRMSNTQAIVDALYEKGPLAFAELAAAVAPRNPSGHVGHAQSQGLVSKSPFKKGGRTLYRYALTAKGRKQASGSDDGSDGGAPTAPRRAAGRKKVGRPRKSATTRAHAKAFANDPPTALRGKRLSAFLLSSIADAPRTGHDLVAALQAVGHPIDSGNGIAGPLAKITAAGWLRRNQKGVYSITPKGRRRLAVPANGSTSDASHVAIASPPPA